MKQAVWHKPFHGSKLWLGVNQSDGAVYYQEVSQSVKNCGCRTCHTAATTSHTRYDVHYAWKFATEMGWTQLDLSRYENSFSKVSGVCPEGHWSDTLIIKELKEAKTCCKICSDAQYVENRSYTLEQLQKIVDEFMPGHTVTGRGKGELLIIVCPHGHIIDTMTLNEVRNSGRCPHCFREESEAVKAGKSKALTKELSDRIVELIPGASRTETRIILEGDTELAELHNEYAEHTAAINELRGHIYQKDHAICMILFMGETVEETIADPAYLAAIDCPENTRLLLASANGSRKDGLTIAEIVLTETFMNQRLREIYNMALNVKKKLELGLPLTLPVDQDEFLEYRRNIIENNLIPQKHLDTYERWTRLGTPFQPGDLTPEQIEETKAAIAAAKIRAEKKAAEKNNIEVEEVAVEEIEIEEIKAENNGQLILIEVPKIEVINTKRTRGKNKPKSPWTQLSLFDNPEVA